MDSPQPNTVKGEDTLGEGNDATKSPKATGDNPPPNNGNCKKLVFAFVGVVALILIIVLSVVFTRKNEPYDDYVPDALDFTTGWCLLVSTLLLQTTLPVSPWFSVLFQVSR